MPRSVTVCLEQQWGQPQPNGSSKKLSNDADFVTYLPTFSSLLCKVWMLEWIVFDNMEVNSPRSLESPLFFLKRFWNMDVHRSVLNGLCFHCFNLFICNMRTAWSKHLGSFNWKCSDVLWLWRHKNSIFLEQAHKKKNNHQFRKAICCVTWKLTFFLWLPKISTSAPRLMPATV